jgi:hypothetical protein
MRANIDIDIDDELLAEAMAAAGLSTKKRRSREHCAVSCNDISGGPR